MGDCLSIQIPENSPEGFDGPYDLDHEAIILARPSLVFWGDPSTIVANAGKAESWGSRKPGGAAYTQATAAQRPGVMTSGGLAEGAWLEFDGVTSAEGDRMNPNFPAIAAPSPLTIIDVFHADVNTTGFLDGVTNGTGGDVRGAKIGSGTLQWYWGDALATAALPVDAWRVALRSAGGEIGANSKSVKLLINGARTLASPTVAPVTARTISLGATSTGNSSVMFDGGFQERMIFAEDVTKDALFLMVLNDWFKLTYELASDPFATG